MALRNQGSVIGFACCHAGCPQPCGFCPAPAPSFVADSEVHQSLIWPLVPLQLELQSHLENLLKSPQNCVKQGFNKTVKSLVWDCVIFRVGWSPGCSVLMTQHPLIGSLKVFSLFTLCEWSPHAAGSGSFGTRLRPHCISKTCEKWGSTTCKTQMTFVQSTKEKEETNEMKMKELEQQGAHIVRG